MPLAELRAAGIADYVARNCDAPGDFWMFLHIPKTAGSSLGTIIAEKLLPYRNIHVGRTGAKPYAEAIQEAVAAFVADSAEKPFRFASGHVMARYLPPILGRYPAMKLFTILRDPVQRVISDYRYQLTETHPTHQAFRAQFPRIEDFVAHRRSQNKMVRFLAPPQARTAEAIIRHVERNFVWVGTLEDYAHTLAILSQLLGVPLSPEFRTRTTERIAENEVQVTPALVAEIRRVNPLDIAVYEHFADLLATTRRDLAA